MRICFVSIDVEPDFALPAIALAKAGLFNGKTGERRGFKGVENLDKATDILKRVGISATFFVTGRALEAYPEKAKQWAEQGFEIACHSYSHRFWTKMSQQERKRDLEKFIALYGQVFGFDKKALGFRAPSHLIDEQALKLLQEMGFLYDASVLPHYPFFKKYRGYQGKAPKVPYYPSPQNCRKRDLPQLDRGKFSRGQVVEIPVAGQLGGIPLAGAWISRIPHWFYKLLFSFSRPQFITVSMHPWDTLDFEGRHTSPQDFLNNLEKLLKILKNKGYSFLMGREIYEQFSKNSR